MTDIPIEGVLFKYGIDFDPNRGGNQKVKCVFHEDTVASASVNLTKGLFNCYGCGVAGDAITLVMLKEGLDYRRAVAIAESLAGEFDGPVSRSVDAGGLLLPRRSGTRQNRRGWRSPWGRREP